MVEGTVRWTYVAINLAKSSTLPHRVVRERAPENLAGQGESARDDDPDRGGEASSHLRFKSLLDHAGDRRRAAHVAARSFTETGA